MKVSYEQSIHNVIFNFKIIKSELLFTYAFYIT